MKQLEEMDTYIEDYRSERIELKRRMLKTDRTALNHLFCEALDDLINQQTDKQMDGEQEEIRYVYLCQLASSRYTESYKVLFGMSNSMLYLDDNKSEVAWYPEPIYQEMKEDMEKVQKRLKEKEERPETKVLLELKQKLLSDNWDFLKEQFQELIEENFYRITDSHLLVEERFSALCGDYMERLPVVWETLKKV